MTVFENLKTKNIDELAEWIDKNCDSEFAPWLKHWDKKYCNKCEPIRTCIQEFDENKHDFAYCEVNGHCKFFKDMNEIPDNKQTIKLWLESEEEKGE